MRMAAAVILFHPPANIISNIESFYNHVEEVFVLDNSKASSLSQNSLDAFSKIELIHDSKNEGIAHRLNTACKLCIQKGYEWLLTMDQDTKFSEEDILIYLNCFYQYKDKEQVAMFGTNFQRDDCVSSHRCVPKEVDRLITSGMLLNLSAYKRIGEFDESLFIDLVDDDYCIAAKKAGYSIVQFTNVYLCHNLGMQVYRSSIKSLYFFKKTKEIHSPLRCYYMYRNMLYIEDKYKGSNIQLAKDIRKIVVSHIKVCMLYSRRTWGILKSILRAKKDFKNNRMGKIAAIFIIQIASC